MGGKHKGSRFTEETSNYDRDTEAASKTHNRSKSSYRTDNSRSPTTRSKKKKPKKNGKKRKKRSRSWPKLLVTLFIFVLLIGAVFLTPLFEGFTLPWIGGRVYPEKADFTVQRTVSLENRGTDNTIDYNLTLAVPEDIRKNEIQIVEDMDYNLQPSSSYRKYGIEWREWDRDLSPQGSENIRVTYDMKTTTISWEYSGDESGTVGDIPDDLKVQYNRNQWQLDKDRNNDGQDDWMIQPEHPDIKKLAEEIVEDEDNVYDKSKSIYDWIDDNVEYDRGHLGGLPKHAAWVLESGSGDCDEQSFLYASLSRAVGIPAWMELGILYDRVRQRWGGHGWIRTKFVQEDGSMGWVNIDPANDQFYFRCATRITTWVDEDGGDHLEDFYHHYITWSPAGTDLRIEDDFEDISMDTEGRILAGNGWAIPGFGIGIVGSAAIISLIIYSRMKKKEDSACKDRGRTGSKQEEN